MRRDTRISISDERRRRRFSAANRFACGLAIVVGVAAGVVAGCDVAPLGGPSADEDRPLVVGLVPLYEVGGIDAEEWDAFTSVPFVRFDDSGHLLVVDSRPPRVVRVAPDGGLAAEFGRRGDGPGELAGQIASVEALGDGTIVLGDGARGRYLRFAPDGSFLGSPPASGDDTALAEHGLRHPEGGIVRWDLSRLEVEAGLHPDTDGIPVRVDPLDGTPPRVVTRAWRPPEGGRPMSLGGRLVMSNVRSLRFAPRLHVAVLPDGRIAVADSSDYRIRLYRPDGTLAGAVERGLDPTPLTESWIEAEKRRMLENIGPAPSPAMADIVRLPDGSWRPAAPGEDGWRLSQELRIEATEFWSEMPLILRIAADSRGHLWVERRDLRAHETVLLDVFGPDGAYLGTLPAEEMRLPSAFGPDGLAAWIEHDELDVASVRVARVVVD